MEEEEDKVAIINVATEVKFISISYANGSSAEDLCIKICQQLGIGPVARHLFALRSKTDVWYHPCYQLDGKERYKLEFRLRFKPSSLQRIKKIDEKAYDYYFQQIRNDVLENKVPDIVYEKHKRELIGLGVCDMYRIMLEKEVTRESVEADYKKYIPKECIKKHSFFIKKPIHEALGKISAQDASFVREQYLQQFENMAPNYLYEEYKAMMAEEIQGIPIKVLLRISAKELTFRSEDINSEWKTLCALEEVCFITIKDSNSLEVSRTNGIPSKIEFKSTMLLMSFLSVLSGYYRLAIRWTFDLCVDAVTPSLKRLYKLKCHGPVGGEFSYAKLEEKRSNRPGTFILRESEAKYNTYYLDACGKDSKPRTRRIEKLGPEDFALSDSMQRFKSIAELISAHKDSENSLYLNECLPPSESDKSLLLLCAPEKANSNVTAEEQLINNVLESRYGSVPSHELQVYKAQPFPKSEASQINNKGFSCGGPSTVAYKAVWQIAKGKKVEVAFKVLMDEKKSMKEFLKLQAKWYHLRSNALIRMFGFTLTPSLGMLLELVKLGPLDTYLRQHPSPIVKMVDMVEAATCLAAALWYLEEHNFVHGNIRCRKLLVQEHTDNTFVVKLGDPGIFSYKPADVHWLPPECYVSPDLAKRSTLADVWAVGTTLWEIFSHGRFLPNDTDPDDIKKFYLSGKRLPQPNGCPREVHKLMLDCWGESDGLRKSPHEILRDISQIKCQVYNSRRSHTYATAYPKRAKSKEQEVVIEEVSGSTEPNSSDGESRTSSLKTDRTSVHWDESDEQIGFTPGCWNALPCDESDMLSPYMSWWAKTTGDDSSDELEFEKGKLKQIKSIFEFDRDYNLILQGRIGQGFYGEVFLGSLEKSNGKDSELQQVAVKKLKIHAIEAEIRDFEREIEIMKTLKHPNIVKILGILMDPEVSLVMEFIKHGSLQSYLAIHRESLTHKKLLGFSLDISTGMDYLGRQKIVHRDLAVRNILVSDDSRVKISDFGLAQVMGKNDYYILQTNRDLPIKWYAPESLRDGKFSTRSDVWSFGVTLFEIFSFGEDPKLPEIDKTLITEEGDKSSSGAARLEEGTMDLLESLEKGVRLPCPATCPQEVYVNIMYPCWNILSHERPTFLQLCNNIKEMLINKY